MKRLFSIRSLALALIAGAIPHVTFAQTATMASRPGQKVIGYQIGEQGANHRQWRKIIQINGAQGRTSYQTNLAYVELADGLNYWSNNQWLESREEIAGYTDGAIAQYGQHKVIFANNLNAVGAIDLQMPDGREIQSHVIGLNYYDAATGKSVLIAQIKDCQGEIASSNQVVYANAFDGVSADVRYTYRLNGLEQDIILTAQPPKPETLGLSSASTILQVFTEFDAAPAPAITTDDSTNEITDEALDFGTMKMGAGKAFSTGGGGEIPVIKQWKKIDGRTILIEAVSFAEIQEQLKKLAQINPPKLKRYVASAKLSLPPVSPAKKATVPMLLAKKAPQQPGFVLDYLVTLNGGQNNYTFQGDTTYYVNGVTTLTGTTTIEGGAVIKYLSRTSIYLNIVDSVVCQASQYHPAIITARDDNTVGEPVAGSSGNPSGYYASVALQLPSAGGSLLSNLRILYARTAIMSAGSLINHTYPTDVLKHVQFIHCGTGINAVGSNAQLPPPQQSLSLMQPASNGGNGGTSHPRNVYLGNALFSDVSQVVTGYVAAVTIEHLTSDQSSGIAGGSSVSVTVHNSIFANAVQAAGGGATIAGNNNGFYNSTGAQFGNPSYTAPSTPFLPGGAGNYYLSGSYFTDQGTTSINAPLLADLKFRTTAKPVPYANISVSTIPSGTTFAPQAQRDLNTPDLGYHYDPLDYVFQNCVVDTAMTFDPGTAVGWQGQGFSASAGYSISFNGTLADPCYFVRDNTVQEADSSGDGIGLAGSGVWPTVQATFTRFSALGNLAAFFDANSLYVYPLYNCEFWSGLVGGDATGGLWLYCVNCLFDRSAVNSLTAVTSPYAYSSLQNCTFHGGSLTLDNFNNNTSAYVYDCAFDGTIIETDNLYCDASYNAYLSGADTLPRQYGW